MPVKPKVVVEKPISVADVVGAPVATSAKPPAPQTPFIPGPVAAPVSIPMPSNPVPPTPPPAYTPYSNGDRYVNTPPNTPTKIVSGFLDVMAEGHGFLRPKFIPGEGDIYISQSQIRKFQLREGDKVEGQARLPKDNERYLGLLKVEKVNEMLAEDSLKRPHFDQLTPIYPKEQVRLETEKLPLSTRMIDLLAPIGFGQRGLVVSPPKAGKTTILKEMAHGISVNYPKVHLMAVLIGERPEEVTDISRGVKGEVIASNFDEAPEAQTKVAEVALNRAKRMVELGKDVFIVLDSITRLARAYNLCVNPSGRTLSGGFDPAALYPAKKFLGAARKCEEGGSLTILGTALVDTGSRMDDLIYEEFKGTGNMELHLSRALQEQRIFPAIDVDKSGTRHEELLFTAEILKKIVTLRHMLSLLGDVGERTATLIERIGKTKSNEDFLAALHQG
jgi:transcription termination factor Rho